MRALRSSSSSAIECSVPSATRNSTSTPASRSCLDEAFRLRERDLLRRRMRDEERRIGVVDLEGRRGELRLRAVLIGRATEVRELQGREVIGDGDSREVGRAAQLDDRGDPGSVGEVAASRRAEQGREVAARRSAEHREPVGVDAEAFELRVVAQPGDRGLHIVEAGRKGELRREPVVDREGRVARGREPRADRAPADAVFAALGPAAAVDDEDAGHRRRCCVKSARIEIGWEAGIQSSDTPSTESVLESASTVTSGSVVRLPPTASISGSIVPASEPVGVHEARASSAARATGMP